jgi:hypothetical protein
MPTIKLLAYFLLLLPTFLPSLSPFPPLYLTNLSSRYTYSSTSSFTHPTRQLAYIYEFYSKPLFLTQHIPTILALYSVIFPSPLSFPSFSLPLLLPYLHIYRSGVDHPNHLPSLPIHPPIHPSILPANQPANHQTNSSSPLHLNHNDEQRE